MLCKRNPSVAQTSSLSEAPTGPRPIRLAERTISVPALFFEPRPDELHDVFQGGKA